MPTTLLIDGTGLLVRSKLAARAGERAEELSLFLFIRSFIRFVNYHNPGHILVAWDGPGAADWRRSIYPGYKANRPAASHAPEDDPVNSTASHFLDVIGVYQVREAFEADDVISWAVWRSDLESIIAIRSDDADLNQLVRLTVSQYPFSGADRKIDLAAVQEKYGCLYPSDIPAIRALAGDPSDNIPGIPGVGLKTASRIAKDAGYVLGRVAHRQLAQDDRLFALVHDYRMISDLRVRREAVDEALGHPVNFSALCAWNKVPATAPAVACFERWDMKTLLRQAETGHLW